VEENIDDGPEDVLREDPVEHRLGEDFDVLFEADESPVFEMGQAHVGKREDDIVPKGVDHHEGHHQEGRQEVEIGDPVVAEAFRKAAEREHGRPGV